MRTLTLRRFNAEIAQIKDPVQITLKDQILGTFYPVGTNSSVTYADVPVRRAEPVILAKPDFDRLPGRKVGGAQPKK